MSATTLLSQLKGLLIRTEQLRPKLGKVCPTEDQWEDLSDLSVKLTKLTKVLEDEIRDLKDSRTQRAWEESAEHRSNAQSARGELLAKDRLKNHVFRRNIVAIFEGPKDSTFDSEDVKSKKEYTRKRCELIRGLSPDGVISWSIAFAPTLWAGGSMAADVFTCLLDTIEPELVQAWPSTIRNTLHLLKDESLPNCHAYIEFLTAFDERSQQPTDRRKRRHIEDGNLQEKPVSGHSTSPLNEHREMKHMYTNGLASEISKFPEPFQTFIVNGVMWNWERNQGLPRTGCWSTMFPKGNAQDVSFTFWGGHEDGYKLNEELGLQLALSSDSK